MTLPAVFLSVVIPAYNEQGRIDTVLESILTFLSKKPYRWEAIVVDDGSRDGTADRVQSLARPAGSIRLIRHEVNRGKGRAVRTGLLSAQGEAVLFCDADGATPVEELDRVIPVLQNGADLVTGSRRIVGSQVLVRQPRMRKFMGDAYQWICRLLLHPRVVDVTCGFKLLSRKAVDMIAPRMRISGWSFDAEMFLIARLHGLKVMEVPIRWFNRRESRVRLRRDVLGSFWELLMIRWYAWRGYYF